LDGQTPWGSGGWGPLGDELEQGGPNPGVGGARTPRSPEEKFVPLSESSFGIRKWVGHP